MRFFAYYASLRHFAERLADYSDALEHERLSLSRAMGDPRAAVQDACAQTTHEARRLYSAAYVQFKGTCEGSGVELRQDSLERLMQLVQFDTEAADFRTYLKNKCNNEQAKGRLLTLEGILADYDRHLAQKRRDAPMEGQGSLWG